MPWIILDFTSNRSLLCKGVQLTTVMVIVFNARLHYLLYPPFLVKMRRVSRLGSGTSTLFTVYLHG